jgi:predicted permease
MVAAELRTLAGQYRSAVGRSTLALDLGDTSSSDAMLARGIAPTLALVGAGAVALFLVTCANVGNLFLARSLRRQHEITTRLSIGAGRRRLIRQLLTEGLVLAIIAGAVVLGAAAALPSVIVASGGDVTAARFSVDGTVTLATLGAVLFVCLVVSLSPALRTTRVVWRGSEAMATARGGGLRGLLLAVQVALAMALVFSATLVTRGIHHGLTSPMGFAVDTTTAGQVLWPSDATPGSQRRAALRSSLLAASSPTTPIGIVSSVPVSDRSGLSSSVRQPQIAIDYSIRLFPMSASAAGVLDLKLVAGRWASDDTREREAVVNETLAGLLWGSASGIGRTLSLDFNDTDYVIVGVARDAHLRGPREVEPMMHIAADQGALYILTSRTSEAQSSVRAILKALEPTASIRFTPLSESIEATMATARGGALLAGGLGSVALLLAMIGVYGVFSYLVEDRRREIGIRLALGASKNDIRTAVFRATRWALGVGLAGGLILSVSAGVALQSFLFGLSPADPLSYLALAAILAVTAFLATLAPIRRACRVDPATTLRAS